jgi:hypothetical protein
MHLRVISRHIRIPDNTGEVSAALQIFESSLNAGEVIGKSSPKYGQCKSLHP